MATGKLGVNNANAYIGQAISASVDISATGIKSYDWTELNSPPTVPGFTFSNWIFASNTYRFAVIGRGGTLVYYYVDTAFSTNGTITATPIYAKT